jgi:hypothetical protein
MLTSLYTRNLSGLADVDWKFGPELTCITGPIGSGKTLRMRDGLGLLLAGKVPSKRTIACFGKNVQMGVTLEKPGESLSITRSGTSTRILEEPAISGAGVKERVAMFTGIPASDLMDLCYCGGFQLQQNMQLNSSLLATIRAAVGDGINRFAKVVSSEMSVVQARLSAPSGKPDFDVGEMKKRLQDATKAKVEQEQQLMSCAKDTATCQQVLESVLDTEQLRHVARLKAALGPLHLVSVDELSQMSEESVLYDVCKQIRSEYHNNVRSPELKAALPTLYDICRRADLVDVDIRWSVILSMRRELDDYMARPVVSAEQKAQAQEYLRYIASLSENAATSGKTVLELQAQIAQAERALAGFEAQKKKAAADEILRARLELLQTLVQPSGKNSIEKQMLADISFGLLSAATDYLCMCGMRAVMQYDPAVGVQLVRKDGEVRSQELSEGESMIAALCLRMALIRTIMPVPFLVLDDITGSLGLRAQHVTDVLRVFAREQNIPVILNTQELRVTGDSFYIL